MNLMSHEYQALIQALYRDLMAEEAKLDKEPEFSFYHYQNIRLVSRLIEMLEKELD